MSKVRKNQAAENLQPENLEPVAQPETNVQKRTKKGAASRLFAVALAVLSVVTFFIPMLGIAGKKQMLLKSLLDMPKMTGVDVSASLLAVSVYAFAAGLIVALVLSIVTLTGRAKKATYRLGKAFGAYAFGALVYAIALFATLETDVISIVLGVIGLSACIVIAFKKNGKAAWLFILQEVLTLVAFALVALGVGKTALEAEAVAVVGIALLVLSVLIGSLRITAKSKIAFDFIRYVLTLVGAVILGIVIAGGNADAKTLRTYSILAILIAIVQIVIAIIQLRYLGKAEVEEAKAEIESSFEVEEYAEAFPYEGGPVAGVQMAEEVNPTYVDSPAHVNTAGYDFYNCKSFDPFIAYLSNEERNQFTEIFILKFKGPMPELPDYEVGGDNKEFFRKIFIYLGQYRDRIPSGLLAKIYQYSLKIS